MEQEEQPKIKSVETYTDDMVKVLESDKGSTIKKIIQEEEERERQKKNLSPESLRNRIFMIAGMVLLVLALGAMVFATFLGEKAGIVPLQAPFGTAIFVDKNSFNETKDLSAKDTSSLLNAKISEADVKAGGIEGIFLTNNGRNISFGNLNSILKWGFPSSGVSSITDFLIGVYNGTSGKDPLVLLKVSSLDDIFGSMRAWEGTMLSDLSGMFGINITAENKYLLTENFQDGIIENKNARVLYDNNGNIVLMYVFADDNSVIITNGISAVDEVLSRLSGAKVAK